MNLLTALIVIDAAHIIYRTLLTIKALKFLESK